MLTPEQEEMGLAARTFAQRELAPGAAEADRTSVFQIDLMCRLGTMGFMGIIVDADNGGVGADYVSLTRIIAEIAEADGAFSTALLVHNVLVCKAIERHGNMSQKQQFLVPLAKGEKLGCFCLTEPGAGSDAASISTRAVRDGDSYVLNGSKQFITSGKSADIAIVFAVTDPEAGKRGISAFVVPTDTPGYNIIRLEETMGQRASDHCQIALDECRVPAANLLAGEGDGLRIALSELEAGRIAVAAQALGMAKAAHARALSYARDRTAFGKAIIDHQAVSFRLADMATGIHAADLMVWRAASLKDAGQPCLQEASMAKLFASEMAETVCRHAIQTLGGYGYLADFEVERIYRDVRVCSIYEGTSDIQRIVIARNLTDDV
jgi:alkylation response protein AidB-like acyl-CoA dehydrogenase